MPKKQHSFPGMSLKMGSKPVMQMSSQSVVLKMFTVNPGIQTPHVLMSSFGFSCGIVSEAYGFQGVLRSGPAASSDWGASGDWVTGLHNLISDVSVLTHISCITCDF